MKSVKNLLSDLYSGNHKPRGESKPYVPEPEPVKAHIPRRTNDEFNKQPLRTPREPVAPVKYVERTSTESANTASGPCEFNDGEHLWTWKKGVKICQWCEKNAPLDRRDSSTRWKG